MWGRGGRRVEGAWVNQVLESEDVIGRKWASGKAGGRGVCRRCSRCEWVDVVDANQLRGRRRGGAIWCSGCEREGRQARKGGGWVGGVKGA